MKSKASTLKLQLILLVVLRVMIGCHLFIMGITQIVHPEWPSLAFLLETNGNMPRLSHLITSNLNVLCAADFLITWVLITLGLGLILGVSSRRAVFAGAVLLVLYYLVLPNYIGVAIGVPQEGIFLIVNPSLFDALALILISITSVARKFGLGAIFDCRFKLLIISSQSKLENKRIPDIRRAHQEPLSYPLSKVS
jgi:thiosulfate dehydrogenase [quinone] large subunit